MHPTICHLGSLPVHSYGVMLALAILLSSVCTAREAQRKMGVPPDVVYDLVFWVVLGGIVAARIFYIGLTWDYFRENLWEMPMLWRGGLAWQGAFLGGLLTGIVYIKRKQIALWSFLDIVAPYIALGHAIGRVGCLLNGCCYGKPVAWGLYFPVWDARLHPTQIYMSLGQVAIFFLLKALQKKPRTAGQIFIFYLLLSSVERFIVEFFRADHVIYAGGMSILQYVCLIIFFAALVLQVLWVRRTSK